MDLEEVIGDNDAAEDTLIISEQSHVSSTCDGEPEGKPSALQAKIGLFGPKFIEETHLVRSPEGKN